MRRDPVPAAPGWHVAGAAGACCVQLLRPAVKERRGRVGRGGGRVQRVLGAMGGRLLQARLGQQSPVRPDDHTISALTHLLARSEAGQLLRGRGEARVLDDATARRFGEQGSL